MAGLRGGPYDAVMTLPAARSDRTCLVTGASSGIGAEIAKLLAAKGHGVTLVARREAKLRALAEDLASKHGIRAEVITADLTDESSRTNIVSELESRELAVNVLVNNAGMSTMGAVYRGEVAAELTMVRTDVEAVVHLCTALLPGMVERRSGAILNVASTAAFQPLPGQAGYGASKAFVLSYGHAVRAELRGTGVTLTTLCPGPVDTGFGEAAGLTDEEAAGALPKFMWVSSEEVAAAAVAGMDADRAVVIPGVFNRLGAASGWLTPRRLILPLLARQHPALKH
jgi:short-subunit dehydrogenase